MFNKWFVQIMSKINQKRFEKLLYKLSDHLSDSQAGAIKKIEIVPSGHNEESNPFDPYEIVITYYQPGGTDTYVVMYDVVSKHEAEELIKKVKSVLKAKEGATKNSLKLLNSQDLFKNENEKSDDDILHITNE